jgi:hypothetical protein
MSTKLRDDEEMSGAVRRMYSTNLLQSSFKQHPLRMTTCMVENLDSDHGPEQTSNERAEHLIDKTGIHVAFQEEGTDTYDNASASAD